jgi:hypothetical protein
MLLARFVAPALTASCSLGLVACGGTVLFDDGGEGGGGGGNTTIVNSSVGPSTSSVGPSTSSVTVVSSSSGPIACDSGQPGSPDSFQCQDCIGCSIESECAAAYAGCVNDPRCNDFIECIEFCQDDSCAEQCIDDNQAGYDLYVGAVVCLYCESCSVNCDGPSICGF